MTGQQSYYQVLGVDEASTPEEIKKAYRRLALKWHPDKNPESSAEATQKFKEIAEAYEILGKEESRSAYDEERSHLQNSYYYSSHNNDDPFPSSTHTFEFRHPEDIFKDFFDSSDPFDFEDLLTESLMSPYFELAAELENTFLDYYTLWEEDDEQQLQGGSSPCHNNNMHFCHGHQQNPQHHHHQHNFHSCHQHHHHQACHHYHQHAAVEDEVSPSHYEQEPCSSERCRRRSHCKGRSGRRNKSKDSAKRSSTTVTSVDGNTPTSRRRGENGVGTSTAAYEKDKLKSSNTRN